MYRLYLQVELGLFILIKSVSLVCISQLSDSVFDDVLAVLRLKVDFRVAWFYEFFNGVKISLV